MTVKPNQLLASDPAGEKNEELIVLWNALQHGAGQAARERLIEHFLPYARGLAAKCYAKRTYLELEFHDYFQYASIGLIEAIDRYDPERGIKFETFAFPRINGAILNGIESLSEKQEQVSARKRIVASRVESVKNDAPAKKTPEAIFSYLAELAIGLAVGFALEDSGIFQADAASYPDNTYQSIELKQLVQRVRALVSTLPNNEKKVITYHYLQQLAFEEVAKILGLTRGRVSQIHKDAIRRLSEAISCGNDVDISY
ncbi:sigma-70 family RNA polymerase sigma factor [Undibacterium sp. TJN25]|uniref:sigma-70 family RNA polymerase sigma factor n=1 Tax=Undibacterium sp. TJN25 TaxID=3413056 RepID=UPI003BF225F4